MDFPLRRVLFVVIFALLLIPGVNLVATTVKKKGFRATQQYQADVLALQRAKISLTEALGMEERLEKYTKPRILKTLEAKIAESEARFKALLATKQPWRGSKAAADPVTRTAAARARRRRIGRTPGNGYAVELKPGTATWVWHPARFGEPGRARTLMERTRRRG